MAPWLTCGLTAAATINNGYSRPHKRRFPKFGLEQAIDPLQPTWNMKPRIVFLIAIVAVIGIFSLRPRETTSPFSAPPVTEKILPVNAPIASSRAEPEATKITQKAAPLASPAIPTSDERALQVVREIDRALNSTNDADRDLIFTNLLPALVALNPSLAARLIENAEPGPLREELLRRVSHEWAAVDPAVAIEWAANLQDTGERKSALTDASYQIAQSDPAGAIGLAQFFDLGGSDATLENLAQLWAAKDLPAALDWVRGLPAGDQRDQALARVAFIQSQTDPADAARLVVEEIPPGDAQNEAVISVLHQWALQDWDGAAVWVASFLEGSLRESSMSELAAVASY
jgi:hypothetical protein